MITWFNLVAIQEVRDDLSGLRGILSKLSGSWHAVFTDKAGNDERTRDYSSGKSAPGHAGVWKEAVPVVSEGAM